MQPVFILNPVGATVVAKDGVLVQVSLCSYGNASWPIQNLLLISLKIS